MTQTDQLLDLMDSFPDAFKEVQPTEEKTAAALSSIDPDLDPSLQQLIAEFPSAFVDPAINLVAQKATSQSDSTNMEAAEQPTSVAEDAENGVTAIVNAQPIAAVSSLPTAQPGTYAQALRRQISTMTWGQVELYLTYGDDGLQSIWVTVGKSGTEVQSLCEAIARLINLLLAQQVPIPDIARQIRGIRGADSEGLGPNRILGLADLIGKVLQEAPTVLAPTQPESKQEDTVQAHPKHNGHSGNGHSNGNGTQVTDLMPAEVWATIADHDHAASVCPECGAELHQVNGCSGGACVVCGYSSCS